MTNTQLTLVNAMAKENAFEKVLKADKFRKAAELVAETDYEFAQELAEMLNAEAERTEKANQRNKGKKKASKAQLEAQARVDALVEKEVLEKGVYYDFGLVSLVDETVASEPKARMTLKMLVENGHLVVLDKDAKFADGKTRKTYVLADQDFEAEFVPYDLEAEQE